MTQLEFRSVGKSFPGVRALNNVSFSIHGGEVRGLLGENGAGKSTLLKILGGEYVPDEGEVAIDGKVVHFRSAAEAIHAGVAVIHQELQYVPELTVMENLLLGRLPSSWGFVRRREALQQLTAQLKSLAIDLDPNARLRDLSIGQRQMVEISKAILRDASIIALDEPTSSLSHRETEVLFRLVRDLQQRGKVLIYVSHRLDEIFALCNGATVLRDGRTVAGHADLKAITRDVLVHDMVGREIADIYSWRPREMGKVRLEVEGIVGAKLAGPASFSARAGEIVGFFGLVGAGRSELMRLVYGADARTGGTVKVDGVPLAGPHIADAISGGLVFCPEDRKEEGIVGCRSVAENINISARRHTRRWRFFVDEAIEAKTADTYIQRLRIKTPSAAQHIRYLSGGNQQKAVLARWLAEKNLKVLVIDEPTRGIDVGAKNEIYEVLYELAARGVCIVMVSSELPEVLGVADRVIVMCERRIAGELPRAQATERQVLTLALPAQESKAA